MLVYVTVCPSASNCNKPEEVYENARIVDDIGLLYTFTNGFEVQYSCLPGYRSSASLTRICVDGEWTPIKCTRILRGCDLIITEGSIYAYLDGKVIKENIHIPSGRYVNLSCEYDYKLTREDGTVDEYKYTFQRCKKGKLRPKLGCKLKDNEKKKVDGEIVTTANGTKEVLPKLTSENPLTAATLQITTAEDQDNCSPPMNGVMKRSFLDVYEVTCDQGFTLNNIDNNHYYKCVNGTQLNDNNNIEAECMENRCVLGTELLSNMDVLGNSSRNEVYLSPDSRFDPGSELLFHCKKRHHEPVNRIFQCRKGQWIAADEDPSWSMIIDNSNSSCSPAECNRCVYGDCIKDGMCNCHQGAIGKTCATPVCHELCKKNGGRCVRPNICNCSTSRYGDNCEKVGCTLPPENDRLSFKKDSLPAIFEIGAMLSNDKMTCPGDFSPSTIKDLICNGDNKWSEDVFCIPEAIYEIEVTIGTGEWGGSWKTLYVSFINERGQTTSGFLIHTALYRGKTYNADIRTHYIDQIQRLHFTLNGSTFDSLQFQYISLKVTQGGEIEEYAIQRERWMVNDQATFYVDPGCPPPSTNGKLLWSKQRYIVGDKIPSNDAQCEAGYILSSTVTCLNNSNWSATCEKEGEYTLTLSITRAARQYITVVLHGTVGSTPELDLEQHGHLDSKPFSRSWILPSIGEINNIEVNVVDGSPSFGNRYIQIVNQKSNKYYLSFYDGVIPGRTTVQVYDLYRPDCKGGTFLPEQNGYLRNSMLAKLHVISPWQDCRDVCRKDGSCTAVVVYRYLLVKDCYLVSGYSLNQFMFPSYKSEYKIYFRACS